MASATAVKAKTAIKIPTESELLRMAAKDYMNDVQLAFFRDHLKRLKEELLSNAGATSEHLRDSPSVPDPADRATIEEEHALELRTRDRERKLMKKIEQSLMRIESGEYGLRRNRRCDWSQAFAGASDRQPFNRSAAAP